MKYKRRQSRKLYAKSDGVNDTVRHVRELELHVTMT